MKVNAYAAMTPGAKLEPFTYEVKSLKPTEVAIDVTHCGICHSDVHVADGHWGTDCFPVVPGHEVVGTVRELGGAVTHLKAGQRVGVGWQCDSCGQCEWCEQGMENACHANQATCQGHYGGFADTLIVDARFALPIPDGLPSEDVGPLMCGGITVYSPLVRHANWSGAKVAVVGIGGLGHLALKFSRAMGHEVTAFSTSADKEKEARGHGAHHFVVSTDPATLKKLAGSYDLVLSTVYADLDWAAYVELLRPFGTLCLVGASTENLSISPFALLLGQRKIAGSIIGGRKDLRAMLAFAARHGITAMTEVVPMSACDAALDRTRQGKARYRMVLKR
jgi:alcohol/geraniol dehydrogenase (NADP+)